MLVVCDTSPLSNLAIIGWLELLREQFEVVRMPSRVAAELAALRHMTARLALADAVRNSWLIEMPLPESAPNSSILSGLDAGETQALRLAMAIAADVVLIDEKEGRRCATLLGLRAIGVLGVLIRARRRGRILSLAGEIEKLRAEAGFFLDPKLEMQVLAAVGE
jgi:predicted nucleic acid-binding protein